MAELLLQTCVNAAYAASFMALIAVGLVLIFGVMGIINFAHGELYMLGAYAVVYVYADHHLPFWLAVASGLIFVGLLGIAMEHALFRPMRRNPLGGLIVSIGMLLILQALIVAGFGVRMEHIPPPHQQAIPLFGMASPSPCSA
jgi:branched-chain amino acid transport system permease protein